MSILSSNFQISLFQELMKDLKAVIDVITSLTRTVIGRQNVDV